MSSTKIRPEIPNGFVSLIRDKSVSLVGNSVSSLKQVNGKKIDAADLVVRCNRGFQKCDPLYKGTRTDILILGSPGLKGEYSLALIRGLKAILWTKSAESGERLKNVSMELYQHPGLVIYDQEYRLYQRQTFFDDWWPTAGMMALSYLLLSGAKKIDIYGFDFFATGSSYHGQNRSKKWHNPSAEKKLILGLTEKIPERLTIHGHQGT